MILILGHPKDETCKGVMEAALQKGMSVVWWNPLLPARFEIPDHSFTGILNRLGILSWDGERSVKKEDRGYVHQEWSAALLSFLKGHSRCINLPHAPYFNGPHLPFAKQFAWAKDCGLPILRYRFTADPKEAKAFAAEMRGKIVIRQDPDDYRDFSCAPSGKAIFKAIQKQMHYLVEWPEGIPYFYQRVENEGFFSKGYGADAQKAKLPVALKEPLKALAKKVGARFSECLLFKVKNGSWAFGYISSFPELSRYRVHEKAIHQSLLHLLAKNEAKRKTPHLESFIPKSLRPELRASTI